MVVVRRPAFGQRYEVHEAITAALATGRTASEISTTTNVPATLIALLATSPDVEINTEDLAKLRRALIPAYRNDRRGIVDRRVRT